ncbi:hypothetical protein BC343_01195 [Mucilaginibacter pedocola]|uniref:DUF7674 domain-containing protein n=2 Tax=Mucilaginibacter pedocola TaxID=1792845 RepID=A0A1S9PMD0_9SPHI|nr:hypothetical protein BC343_01195 [Mucilaginibacter pedocola]
MLNTNQFLILYGEAFPELEGEIFDNDYRGLLPLQVGLLGSHINYYIKSGMLKEVKRVFIFFEQMMPQVNSEVENALVVSFLEHVKMDGDNENEIAARKLLAPQYLQLWKSLRQVMLPPKTPPGKTKTKRRR